MTSLSRAATLSEACTPEPTAPAKEEVLGP